MLSTLFGIYCISGFTPHPSLRFVTSISYFSSDDAFLKALVFLTNFFGDRNNLWRYDLRKIYIQEHRQSCFAFPINFSSFGSKCHFTGQKVERN
uniref:Uncharacterized protein n=1 Tax=Candidatus Kentrum sp. DK TaxID=2126562 RepID=A0A450TGF9_9GAMM|nr:MAG: hypothetical protein BECKDK2373B_GA0170837_11636 [Candidatus Kentron sp. DK]